MAKRTPTSRTATVHAKFLGKEAFKEYLKLREGYKSKGLSPVEAKDRAYVELQIKDRYYDLKRRRSMGKMLDSQVPLTPEEINQVSPGLIKPLGSTEATEIGEQDMSHIEQVQWAKRMVARVQNGEENPTVFPCDGALFWYQTAIGNRDKFLGVLQKSETSGGDIDNQYMSDSQYHYSEIEKQVKAAVLEVGTKMKELEAGFAEVLESING